MRVDRVDDERRVEALPRSVEAGEQCVDRSIQVLGSQGRKDSQPNPSIAAQIAGCVVTATVDRDVEARAEPAGSTAPP